MELVWNNPSPNRTVDRPTVWEVFRRDGTSRAILAHDTRAIADRTLELRIKEEFNDLQTLFSSGFCF
jgi:hypothetical protein